MRRCKLLIIAVSLIFFAYNPRILINSELINIKVDVDAEVANITAYMRQWATSLSQELVILSKLARREKVEKSFENYTIHDEDWDKVVEEVATNIREMMDEKIKAVQAIKQHAELLSLYRKQDDITRCSSYDYYDANEVNVTENVEDRSEDIEEAEKIWKCSIPATLNHSTSDLCFDNSYTYQSDFPYAYASTEQEDPYSYRKISQLYTSLGRCDNIAFLHRPKNYYREMNMADHPQFGTAVNLNYSIVRVTPTVYKRDDELLNEIRWSEALDLTFKCNFRRDPTLTYQYFGSPKGFLRFYPATQWSEETYDDSLDFRVRSWYIEAMTSAKDIIILLDRSGSMESNNRRDVGKEIVNAILDTLTDNDYVNIYTFTNSTESLVDCFNNTLVQANEENLRLLREQLYVYKDEFYSDISLGLEKAFSILWSYRSARRGGIVCNQAIMLITEGLDYEYNEQIYDKYNHLPNDDKYYRPIRIFTYLLGTEEMDSKRMKWIACANMGYFVNISGIEEVREKVHKYLEVLSRPINLSPNIEPKPAWTALYVHLADRRLSNWLWKKYEGNKQRDTYIEFEKQDMLKKGFSVKENQTHFTTQTSHDYEQYQTFPEYKYLTSVSLPVFDLRPNRTKSTLLGVAGVDVPLDYLKQLAEPHRIGVNGYSFTITNNGYVLHHPDHLTEFAEHVLKPTFNRVDLTEVEMSDETHEPRVFDQNIIDLRHYIVLQKKGKRKLRIRAPIDNMKRVMLGFRHYFYTKIEPFSMVIALPDGYGFFFSRMKVTSAQMRDIKRHLQKSLKNNKNWRVHPKWLYTCNTTRAEVSPESELLHYLNTNATNCKEHDVVPTDDLLKDVYVTEWWNKPTEPIFQHVKQKSSYYSGVVLTFMATHTGLTRWRDLFELKHAKAKHFANQHNKATDEIYYRRGADMNYKKIHKDTFIFSVPFEKYNESTTLITGSQVIFREVKHKRAPIAAVGFQILHKTLNPILQTFTCEQPPCKITCAGPDAWICYVIDNDAYVILSNNTDHIGLSLADVDYALMKALVKDEVFKEITIFDYQGTCLPVYRCGEPGSRCSIKSFYGPTWEQVQNNEYKDIDCTKPHFYTKCKTIEFLRLQLNKTTPTPCDFERKMYNYKFRPLSHLRPEQNNRDCPCPYITEPIKGTNLLLLALDGKCCDPVAAVTRNIYPKEITYNMTLPCYIAVYNNYTKRHYTKCITRHPAEYKLNQNTTFCGSEGFVPFE